MPVTIKLDAVNFGFKPKRNEAGELEGMMVIFADPSQIIGAVVPFTSLEAWENFKRHVAADGELPTITLATTLEGAKPPEAS